MLYKGISNFPFLETCVCSWQTGGGGGGRGTDEAQRSGPQQQRGVSLMAGGGRKSQDLMFGVKLSNSHRHTSDTVVGGRCITTPQKHVGIVISLQVHVLLNAASCCNIVMFK